MVGGEPRRFTFANDKPVRLLRELLLTASILPAMVMQRSRPVAMSAGATLVV